MGPTPRCFAVRRTRFLIPCLLAVSNLALAQTVVYVDASANGTTHDGSTWCNAYLTLHPALVAATGGTTIRVATGVYHPDPTGFPDPRKATFTLKNGVTVEGGYAGCGAPNPNARDVTTFATVLSGDVAGNDPGNNEFRDCCHSTYELGCPDAACQSAVCAVHSFCCEFGWEEVCVSDAQSLCGSLCQTGSDNSYHVVTASGTDATAVLDGVTITEGKADDPTSNSIDALGAGLYADVGSPTLRWVRLVANGAYALGGGAYLKNGTAQLANCTIVENYSRSFDVEGAASGGGAYVEGGSPTFTDCAFNGNQMDSWGFSGGLHLKLSDPLLIGTRFEGNWGWSVYAVLGSPTIRRCAFVANGGGVSVSGTAPSITDSAIIGNFNTGISYLGGELPIVNTLLVGNFSGGNGGGLVCGGGRMIARNCTIVGNTSFGNGGGFFADGTAQLDLVNSIVWGNMAFGQGPQGYLRTISTFLPHVSVSYCDVQSAQAGIMGSGNLVWDTGNIDADPLFIDPAGLDNVSGNEDDDLRLAQGSPCVDAGNNASIPVGFPMDLEGNQRIVDGNHDGPSTVDLGAYERQLPVPAIGEGGFAFLLLSLIIAGTVLIRSRVTIVVGHSPRRLLMRPPPPPRKKYRPIFSCAVVDHIWHWFV